MTTKKPYPPGEKLRNFIAVVAGVLLFFVLLFALFPVFEKITGVWQPAGDIPLSTVTSYSTIGLAMLLLFSIGCAAGFTASIISTRRAGTHAFISGLLLVVLYALAIGKDVPWGRVLQSPAEAALNIGVPLLLLLGPCIGGWAGKLARRKRTA